jgi:hypothetical protein
MEAESRNLTVSVYVVRLSVIERARKDILAEFRFIPPSQYFNVRNIISLGYIHLEKLTVALLLSKLPPFTQRKVSFRFSQESVTGSLWRKKWLIRGSTIIHTRICMISSAHNALNIIKTTRH